MTQGLPFTANAQFDSVRNWRFHMPITIRFALLFCVGTLGLLTIGCAPPASAPPTTNSSTAKDDHDHDHGDHDHGKDDHDHDHADHDHKDGDHDHDKHAHSDHEKSSETYADAVKEIEALQKSVKENFEADKLEDADTAVHEVGHVLEEVTKLAEKASLSPEDLESVKKNVEVLFDAFGKIDDRLHSKDAAKGSDYKGVAKEIESAIEVLKSKVKAEASEKSNDNHADEAKSEPAETPKGDAEEAAKNKEAAEKAGAEK